MGCGRLTSDCNQSSQYCTVTDWTDWEGAFALGRFVLNCLLKICYSNSIPRSIYLIYKDLLIQAIPSIIGATLKRLDTAEPVFTWGVAEFCTILLYVF